MNNIYFTKKASPDNKSGFTVVFIRRLASALSWRGIYLSAIQVGRVAEADIKGQLESYAFDKTSPGLAPCHRVQEKYSSIGSLMNLDVEAATLA